jgi:glycosyltransferase involved in cell wall biosynthesis
LHAVSGRPRVGVVAEFDWRVDEGLIEKIARERPTWQIVLVGPRSRRWGTNLFGLPNVVFVGQVQSAELAVQIESFHVALIPYVVNDWTRACLPVKVFDYLAQGRPVVSTLLPELTALSDVVEAVPADRFISAIERALQEDGTRARARRLEASARFTLQDRAQRAASLVSERASLEARR